jgi:hypothetical protein
MIIEKNVVEVGKEWRVLIGGFGLWERPRNNMKHLQADELI